MNEPPPPPVDQPAATIPPLAAVNLTDKKPCPYIRMTLSKFDKYAGNLNQDQVTAIFLAAFITRYKEFQANNDTTASNLLISDAKNKSAFLTSAEKEAAVAFIGLTKIEGDDAIKMQDAAIKEAIDIIQSTPKKPNKVVLYNKDTIKTLLTDTYGFTVPDKQIKGYLVSENMRKKTDIAKLFRAMNDIGYANNLQPEPANLADYIDEHARLSTAGYGAGTPPINRFNRDEFKRQLEAYGDAALPGVSARGKAALDEIYSVVIPEGERDLLHSSAVASVTTYGDFVRWYREEMKGAKTGDVNPELLTKLQKLKTATLFKQINNQMLAKVNAVRATNVKMQTAGNSAPELAIQRQTALLPADWIDRANAYGKVNIERIDEKSEDRANHRFLPMLLADSRENYLNNPGDSSISLKKGDSDLVVFHELIHRIQATHPELDAIFQAEWRRRTQGEELQRLCDLEPTTGYQPYEVAKPDALPSNYYGRYYEPVENHKLQPSGALEMFTMAMQDVFSPTINGTFGYNLGPVTDDNIMNVVMGALLEI